MVTAGSVINQPGRLFESKFHAKRTFLVFWKHSDPANTKTMCEKEILKTYFLQSLLKNYIESMRIFSIVETRLVSEVRWIWLKKLFIDVVTSNICVKSRAVVYRLRLLRWSVWVGKMGLDICTCFGAKRKFYLWPSGVRYVNTSRFDATVKYVTDHIGNKNKLEPWTKWHYACTVSNM